MTSPLHAHVLAELDTGARSNLQIYLKRELEREYSSKQKNKAQKLPADALENLDLAGEQLRARVRDGQQIMRIDMTFPLFDLDADFTLIQCSCLRDAVSLDVQRCHHMYFVQKQVADQLDWLERQTIPTSPLDLWESLWLPESRVADDRLCREERWRFLFDPESWDLLAEKEVRNRYEPEAPWRRIESLSWEAWCQWLRSDSGPEREGWRAALARGGGHREREIFHVLALWAREGLTIARSSGQSLTLTSAVWRLAIEESGAGFWLRPQLDPGGLPWHRLIKGAGAIAFTPEGLWLAPLDEKAERFAEQILSQKAPIPPHERERMLGFLQRLDPRLLQLANASSLPPKAVERAQSLLRLTPFVRGGMKVEVLVQIARGLLVKAGEGDEQIGDLGRGGLWQRDFVLERQLVRRLVRLLDLEILPEPEPDIFVAYNDAAALDLMQRVENAKAEENFILEWPESLRGGPPPYALAPPLDKASLQVSVGEKHDWFQLEGWLAIDEKTRIDLRELLAAIRQQKKYIQLPDGRWALVAAHFRQRLEPLAEASEDDGEAIQLDIAGLEQNPVAEALAAFPFAAASQKFWRLVGRAKHRREIEPSLPEGLHAELRPYQRDGYRWMHHLYEAGLGACLADDMGLGKTVQTLALLLKMAARGPSLVIAPTSLAFNWAAEAQRFCPTLRLRFLRDMQGRGQGQVFGPGEILVASYGLTMRYAENLAAIDWNIIVLDEAQIIKNATTKTAQAVQTLKAQWMLGLSGTPLENRLSDLWSLFRTLSPGLFGEWERFRRSYVFPIERDGSDEARQRLKRKLGPFVLRRMKKDYLSELPDKTEVDLWVDLSDDERQFYDALRGEAIAKVQDVDAEDAAAQAKQRMQVLAALTRLRQAACHRLLVDPSWEGGASKVELLRERVGELSEAGHSALVFSQFTRFLRLIEAQLIADGRRVLYLDGGTPIAERQNLVEQFQAGGYDAFLISLKAGGTGLNLTRASYVFHMDPWWNPAVEQQATDRAHRMGQKQAVTVYRLRARETIEEMIHQIHGEKRELVDSLLAGRAPDAAWSWDTLWQLLAQGANSGPALGAAPKSTLSVPGLGGGRAADRTH